jgi:alanine racemase
VRAPIEERLAAAGLPPLPRTAWLEIDLDALVSNLGVLREAAGADVAIRPVVKADAYGHGMVPVARALAGAGVDGLSVATADEALVLRAAGIVAPILVLYPVPTTMIETAMRARIAISAGEPASLAAILVATAAAVASVDLGPLIIELEVETGLGRGGVPVDGVVDVARRIASAPGVVLGGLWTHLQAPQSSPARAAQIARFEEAATALVDAGLPLPPRHATASTGLVADGLIAYDGVRPGLAIYGLVPDELAADQRGDAAARLRPILSLHARPVRVLDLPEGSGVSYGPTFVTDRPSRIATLPIGYGDGWSRSLSNRASALVRGRRVPLVGNVAMDAVMADVTDVPGPPVTTGDEFTLIGSQEGGRITVADLAQARTTNAWEVVTTIAARVPRVYHARPGLVDLRTLNHWS